jgi:hypothetical protein
MSSLKQFSIAKDLKMDELSKLQDSLGEDQVAEAAESDNLPWTHYPKPKHLYEGTDSEDDEDIMRNGRVEQYSSWDAASAADATGKITFTVLECCC